MPEMRAEGPRILSLDAELTLDRVSELAARIRDNWTAGVELQCDGSPVTECDTAGVQLLCVVAATAARSGGRFTLVSPSKAIREAAAQIGVPLSEIGIVEDPLPEGVG